MNDATPQDTSSGSKTENIAFGDVDTQIGVVRDSNVFIVPPNATNQDKYEIGKNYLNSGVPVKAEELISEAIAGGLNSTESQFYRVLAVFSKRSYRDLDRVERDRLDQLPADLAGYPEDKHRDALEAIAELLPHLRGEDCDVEKAEKRLLSLEPDLVDQIQRHLVLILSGTTQDKLWDQRQRRAREAQFDSDRLGRAWAYFHSLPIPARSIQAIDSQNRPADWTRAIGETLTCAVALGHLAWLALSEFDLLALLAFAAAAAAGHTGLQQASEWRYRIKRLDLEERRNFQSPASTHPRKRGFARSASRMFEYYFAKFAPEGWDADDWLEETAGVRGRLRDEIILAYRESRVPVSQVAWLIHFLARETRHRWEAGTLYDYRERLYITPDLMRRCALGLAGMIAGLAYVFGAVVQSAPLTVVLAALGILVIGPFAATSWQRIIFEQRRWADDDREYHERLAERQREYERWKHELEAAQPSEREMEAWIDCDKTILIDNALQHYRLSWHEVMGHAVLQGPSPPTKAARAVQGPWRYARYALRLFLITADGVREVMAELDFKRAKFVSQQRNNFRFDTLSSVNVIEGTNDYRALGLTLNNGPTRLIKLTEDSAEDTTAETSQSDDPDQSEELLEINLSAAGFSHALQILEGIAAEGKGWADRNMVHSRDPHARG